MILTHRNLVCPFARKGNSSRAAIEGVSLHYYKFTLYQQVNLSPALGADSDVDAAVKKPMLHDMFDLLGLPVSHTGLSMFTSWLPQQEDSTSDSEDYASAPE